MGIYNSIRNGRAVAGLLVAFGAAATAAPATAQQITLKLSHPQPTVHGVHKDYLAPWAEELERRTNGKVKVTIYPAGSSFGNVERQLDQVKAGVVDIASGFAAIPRDRLPRSELIELPMLTEDRSVANRALWAISGKHLSKEYVGLKLLGVNVDCTALHTRNKTIRTFDDLKGLRIRTPSVMVTKLVSVAGAVPVSMPWGQIYENLEKGVIDGAVTPWDPVASMRLHEVVNNHLDNVQVCGAMWLAMNEAKYKALPEDVRAAIDALSGDNLLPKFDQWYPKWTQTAKEAAIAAKSTITKLPEADFQRWRELARPIVEERLAGMEAAGVADARGAYKDLLAEIARLEAKR